MNKKISILMTVFNGADFLKESIESILNQTYKDFELVIINDYSTDNTIQIIKKFNDDRIKLYNLHTRFGRTKALNYGLNKCSSELIAIQDADDVSNNTRLEKSLKEILKDENLGLVFTNFEIINSKNKILQKQKIDFLKDKKIFLSKLKYINLIAHSSVIFRRNIKRKNFFYDENYEYAQDYQMILYYLKNSQITQISENLVKIRHHSSNMTNQKKLYKKRIFENINLLFFSENQFKNSLKEKNFYKIFQIKKLYKINYLRTKQFNLIFQEGRVVQW